MSPGWSKREAGRFTEEMKFLIVAGMFFTVGVFCLSTFFLTGIEDTVDDENWSSDNPLIIQYKKPKLHPLTNLEDGDVIYIEYKADGPVDVMVDDLDNCYRYIAEHDSFNPYDLPPEAYKVREGRSGTLKVNVTSDEVGIVFQKTLYSGYEEVNLQYKVTSPDHYSSACLIIGLMFFIGGTALVVIHFMQKKKQRRFEPMDTDDDLGYIDTGEEDDSVDVAKRRGKGGGKKKGKGKGKKGKGKKK